VVVALESAAMTASLGVDELVPRRHLRSPAARMRGSGSVRMEAGPVVSGGRLVLTVVEARVRPRRADLLSGSVEARACGLGTDDAGEVAA
jgi:hypothetical protein